MGTTATSLHLLIPASVVPTALFASAGPTAGPRDVDRAIEKGYGKLGYAKARKPDDAAPKQVAIVHDGGASFVSIYDADNDKIDSGELKDLAASLSKTLKTLAILTSVYDSDSFEFIMYHRGKQVDAAVSAEDAHAGGLNMLRGKRRARAWDNIFFERDVTRARRPGAPPFSLRQRLADFEEAVRRAERIESAFAEDGLGAWCSLAGLDPGAALANYSDKSQPDIPNRTLLALRRTGVPPARKPQRGEPGGGVTLAYVRSDDDHPYHRFFPAAWPVAAEAAARFSWAVVSSGAGFSGLSLALHLERTSGFAIGGISLRAFPFYNGQITSATALASFDWLAPPDAAASAPDLAVEATPFALPDLDPQSRKQFIVLIAVELRAPAAGAMTIRPSLRVAEGGDAPSLGLPPLRLAVTRPTWRPLVADWQKPTLTQAEALLRLNAPSVLAMVAVLPDDGDEVRHRIRRLAEQWLALLGAGELFATIETQKHMTPSFSVPKSKSSLPLPEVTRAKIWPKLFEVANRYQTVMVGLGPDGSSYPLAGFTMQSALLDGSGAPAGHARSSGPTISVAIWLVNEAAAFERLGVDPDAAEAAFSAWVETLVPVQAWVTRSAWIPEFDFYEDYMMTLYESATSVDWFRGALQGTLTDTAWSSTRLRFVAPKLWLGPELAAAVDLAALAGVATVATSGPVTRIDLPPGAALEQLEQGLANILPVVLRP
ncbi:MAG: hypothetical protein JO273_05725 [Methylobacteriaceae bacterium]|nr:hypothetical protein [Methylobacteriaceae bacterium]